MCISIYGSLNANGLHKLIESSPIRRYGLVKVGMALLEEVWSL